MSQERFAVFEAVEVEGVHSMGAGGGVGVDQGADVLLQAGVGVAQQAELRPEAGGGIGVAPEADLQFATAHDLDIVADPDAAAAVDQVEGFGGETGLVEGGVVERGVPPLALALVVDVDDQIAAGPLFGHEVEGPGKRVLHPLHDQVEPGGDFDLIVRQESFHLFHFQRSGLCEKLDHLAFERFVARVIRGGEVEGYQAHEGVHIPRLEGGGQFFLESVHRHSCFFRMCRDAGEKNCKERE